MEMMKLSNEELSRITFYEGRGCDACHHTGFKGRTAIFEYLPMNGAVRTALTNKENAEQLKKIARESGLKTLREDGWEKVKLGVTTISEILRVTLEA